MALLSIGTLVEGNLTKVRLFIGTNDLPAGRSVAVAAVVAVVGSAESIAPLLSDRPDAHVLVRGDACTEPVT